MHESFETLGNATVIVSEGHRPILATDPWLVGTCYYGSWALDHPLTPTQIERVQNAEYIWISHGHPDHLHEESLGLLPRRKKILLPDHYDSDIRDFLLQQNFEVEILPYRTWRQLSATVRVLCIDNRNQDAVLVIEAGDSLILNLNDSPLCGEFRFLRRLVRARPRSKTYLLALCSMDADMMNFVDSNGDSLAGDPEERKPGTIWEVARLADRLGVGAFCCSSSQHLYVRSDSAWANPYRITFADMQRFWSRSKVRLIEPFVTVDLQSGTFSSNHPSQRPDEGQLTNATGEDDWSARLAEADWAQLEKFIRRFEMVRRYIDFVEFVVGGESRRIDLRSRHSRRPAKQRGITFIAPRQSLLSTFERGYLDDLLIGNFVKVRLTNTKLYPRFTPLVAKLGGNAKVYTKAQYRRFMWRYFSRNPLGTLVDRCGTEAEYVWIPWLRDTSERLGIKRPLKYLYRAMLGDPMRS
jgi:hypothetical protein